MFRLGAQRVGIVTQTPVLDGGGNPVVSEFGEPQTTESVAWVDGCVFEVWGYLSYRVAEIQQTTTTTSEPARVWMPITAESEVPAVGGGVIDPATITSSKVLRYAGTDYVMRGDAVVEVDNRGRPNHVFCICEAQGG